MARSSRLVIALSCLETNQTQSRLSSPEKHMLRDEDRTDGLSTSGRELRRALPGESCLATCGEGERTSGRRSGPKLAINVYVERLKLAT